MVLFAFGLLSALIDAEKARAARTEQFAADLLAKHVESDCRSSNPDDGDKNKKNL